MIKVHELIERLSHENPESPVILSTDEEGNGFRHLSAMGFSHIDKESASNWDVELIDLEDPDNDWLPEEVQEVVLLWP